MFHHQPQLPSSDTYLICSMRRKTVTYSFVTKLTWVLNFTSSFMLLTSDISVRDVLWNKPSNYSSCCYWRMGVSKNCFNTTAHIHSTIWYTFRIILGIKTAWKSNKILGEDNEDVYKKIIHKMLILQNSKFWF